VACLAALGGCQTSTKLGDLISKKTDEPAAIDSTAENEFPATAEAAAATDAADTTGSVAVHDHGPVQATSPGLLGTDPNDDLSLGKRQYRAGNFGDAEKHFRRAVELHPRDAESWVGLAAAYDRLRRFDLADRAYKQAIAIIGPTPEILNNQGFSYMLRGDYAHAREKLLAAQAKDPGSPYIQNNLELLEKSTRHGRSVL
jgi:Flp pilus assembly protein TadD